MNESTKDVLLSIGIAFSVATLLFDAYESAFWIAFVIGIVVSRSIFAMMDYLQPIEDDEQE